MLNLNKRWLPNVGHNIASQRDKIFESIEQIINHIEEVREYYCVCVNLFY